MNTPRAAALARLRPLALVGLVTAGAGCQPFPDVIIKKRQDCTFAIDPSLFPGYAPTNACLLQAAAAGCQSVTGVPGYSVAQNQHCTGFQCEPPKCPVGS